MQLIILNGQKEKAPANSTSKIISKFLLNGSLYKEQLQYMIYYHHFLIEFRVVELIVLVHAYHRLAVVCSFLLKPFDSIEMLPTLINFPLIKTPEIDSFKFCEMMIMSFLLICSLILRTPFPLPSMVAVL